MDSYHRHRNRIRPMAVRNLRITAKLSRARADMARNLYRHKQDLRFDVAVFFAALGLFALNSYVIKPFLLGVPYLEGAGGIGSGEAYWPLDASSGIGLWLANLMVCHCNDLLGGLAFMAYLNALFDLVRPGLRITGPVLNGACMLCCGLFWEYAAPLFVTGSVSDPLDLIAYVVGGLAYWCLDLARRTRTHEEAHEETH